MADDRTPRTISLTECPPDDDVPHSRKKPADSKQARHTRPDEGSVAAGSPKTSERSAEERTGPRLT
jgi:hypothetical protein